MEAKNSSPRILITGYMPFNSSFSGVSLKMYRFIQCFTGYLFLPRLQEVLGSLAEGLLKSYGKLMWHAVDLVFDLNSRRKTYGPISTVAWKLLFIVMVQMKVTLRTKMSNFWEVSIDAWYNGDCNLLLSGVSYLILFYQPSTYKCRSKLRTNFFWRTSRPASALLTDKVATTHITSGVQTILRCFLFNSL